MHGSTSFFIKLMLRAIYASIWKNILVPSCIVNLSCNFQAISSNKWATQLYVESKRHPKKPKNVARKNPHIKLSFNNALLRHKNCICTDIRCGHLCLHHQFLLNWCCAPSMVQFTNTLCYLASFENFSASKSFPWSCGLLWSQRPQKGHRGSFQKNTFLKSERSNEKTWYVTAL